MLLTYSTGREYDGLEKQQAGAVRMKRGATIVSIIPLQKARFVDDGEEGVKELEIIGHKLIHGPLRGQGESPFPSQILYVVFIQPRMLHGPRDIIISRDGQQRRLAVRGKAAEEGIMRDLMEHGMLRDRARHRRRPGRSADAHFVAQQWRLLDRLMLPAPLLAGLDKTVKAIQLALGAWNAGLEHVAANLAGPTARAGF